MRRIVAAIATLALLCGSANAVLLDYTGYTGGTFTDAASGISIAFTGTVAPGPTPYTAGATAPFFFDDYPIIGTNTVATFTIPSGYQIDSLLIYDNDQSSGGTAMDDGNYVVGGTSTNFAVQAHNLNEEATVIADVETIALGGVNNLIINNPGGWGSFTFNADYSAVPVPEPTAFLAMVFAGVPCAAVGYFRRRKQIAAA